MANSHTPFGRIARRRNQRGAALVEAAIVFIPLCIIVFGIIEYGFVFKDSLTLSSATRAGARTGSAMPGTEAGSFMTQTQAAVEKAAAAANFKDQDEMWVFLADATTGNPPATCGNATCNLYKWNATSKSWGNYTGSWDPQTAKSCLGTLGSASNIDSVGIKLILHHDAITGFFHDLRLTEKTVMKFEPTTANCTP